MRAEIRWVLWELCEREGSWPSTLPWQRAYQLHLDQLLEQIDPTIRRYVEGSVKKHISVTLRLCSQHDRTRWTARVAYLEFHNRHTAFEPAAVAAAVSELGGAQKPPKFRFLVSGGVLLLTILLGVIIAKNIPDWWLHDDLEEPTATAYVTGGRPLVGGEVEQAWFNNAFPDFVVGLDRARRSSGGVPPAEQEEYLAVREGTVGQVGAQLETCADPIHRYLEILMRVQWERYEDPEDIFKAEEIVNACLRDLGMGYQLETHPMRAKDGTRMMAAGVFRVERVEFFEAEGHQVQTLFWRRLDNITWRRQVLGYTQPDIPNARVLVHKVDRFVTRGVLPALMPDAPIDVFDIETRGTEPWARAFEATAAAAVREEIRNLTGDPESTAELGRLLSERNALFKRWNRQLKKRGGRLRPAEDYALNLDRYDGLESSLLPGEITTFQILQRRLHDEDIEGTFEAIRDAVMRSVANHEVQHRLDYKAQRLSRLPDSIAAYTGQSLDEDGNVRGASRSVLAEYSAYLSELGRSPHLVRTNLVWLARNILNRDIAGTVESYAAAAILEALSTTEILVNGVIVRERVAQGVASLLHEPPAALAQRAKTLWQDNLQAPLPVITRRIRE